MDENTGKLQGQRENIVIRQYQHPDDLSDIRRIFVDATMTGRTSPFQRGLTMYNVYRVIYAAIGSIAFLQIVSRLLVLQDDVLGLIFWIQAGIGILCLMAPIYTWHRRRQVRRLFRIFVDEGLAGELVDIVKSYNLHVTESGSCIPRGPCGFWVAEIGGKFAGCVGLNLQTDPTVGGVRRLLVVPTHQNKGVAKKLMTALTSHARDHQLHALELTTSIYNQTALHLYKKLGWKITGRTNYHGFALVVLRFKLSIGPKANLN